MPDKLPTLSLDTIVPTDAELQAARSDLAQGGDLLASNKRKKAVAGSMIHYLKENKTTGINEDLLKKKGLERDDLVVKYWCHQSRHKQSKLEGSNERELGKLSQKMVGFYEEMHLAVGALRGAELRASGKAPWKVCPLTGKETEHVRLWNYPKGWTRMTDQDWIGFRARVSGEQSANDLNDGVTSMASTLGCQLHTQAAPKTEAASEASALVPVKLEPLSPQQEQEKNVKEFLQSKKSVLQTINAKILDYEIMRTKLTVKIQNKDPKVKYSGNFKVDLEKHIAKFNTLCEIMHKVCPNDPSIKPNDILDLMITISQLEENHIGIIYWANRFEVMPEEENASRRGKRTKISK